MKKSFLSGLMVGGPIFLLLVASFTLGGTDWTARNGQTGVSFFVCWFWALVLGVGFASIRKE